MLNRLMKNKKLDELIEVKKADESIYQVIKENEKEYDNIKKNIKKLNEELDKINEQVESKKQEKSQIPVFKIKEFSQAFKDVVELKKLYKQKQEEIASLEAECVKNEELSSRMKAEIEEQYTVYQENEILIKVVEKIELKGIDLASDFYSKYIKHVNAYMNSVYSIEEGTKIKEPDAADLVFLLSVLKRNEELQNKKSEAPQNDSAEQTVKVSTKRATDPKKVVEEITVNKVINLNDDQNAKNAEKSVEERATKKQVVNQ